MQDTSRRGGFLVRQILGPTVMVDGVELGPLDGRTQLAIAAKVIQRSTAERLGARYRTLTSHHDRDSTATTLTWVFDKSPFGSLDETASLTVLSEALDAWAAETAAERATGNAVPLEAADGARNGFAGDKASETTD